jgi:hypothetical protein
MSTSECFLQIDCAGHVGPLGPTRDDKNSSLTVWALDDDTLGIRVHDFNHGTYRVNMSVEDARKLSDCLNLWAMNREQAE